MKIKTLEYELSENTKKSVENSIGENSTFNVNKVRKSKKGKTFLMINMETSKLNIVVPVIHKNKIYGGKIPKPSSLFLGQAIEFEKKTSELLNSFSKYVELTLHKNPNLENSYLEDNIYLIKNEKYYEFLIYKISSITALISTVECFTNEIIPENFTIKNKKGEIIGKEKIERFWNLKSKLKTIVPKIREIKDFKDYEMRIDKFLELNKIRNEFTHMKTKLDGKNMDPYIEYFQQLVNLNLKEKIEETKMLLEIME